MKMVGSWPIWQRGKFLQKDVKLRFYFLGRRFVPVFGAGLATEVVGKTFWCRKQIEHNPKAQLLALLKLSRTL
jgi:hypothetical protein